VTFSEDRRQIVHIAMGGWALLLRWLTWPQAAVLAVMALAFNTLALPRIGGRSMYRAADLARGYPLGILLYPFVVLVLIVTFRQRLDLTAAAWGILAAGDGFATIVGQRLPEHRLPWNREKTIAGLLAFVICGSIAGAALAVWTARNVVLQPSIALLVIATIAAAIASAFVETIPVRLDDNISVPVTAGFVLWAVSAFDPAIWGTNALPVLLALKYAVPLNAVVATLGYVAGTVSISGVIAGIGTAVYACAGPGAWVLLLASFAAAAITSRVGQRRKLHLGIAEERGGRRGASNALANTGLAAVAAVLAAISPHGDAAMAALAAALIAGSSDTVASEIGKAFGRRTFLIVGLRPVPPGTSGALSLEGTAAGVAAAFGLAFIARAAGVITPAMVVPVAFGAIVASFIESALGATLEAPRVLNNDLLNFVNTAAAAALALAFMGWRWQ
jgi:uncharacterized protein (TIGR00297 family)